MVRQSGFEDENDTQEPGLGEYEDELDREASLSRWLSVMVVIIAIAGFFGLAWYAYKSGGDVTNEQDAELITADSGPVKEAPENPGGMAIPNQDKTVYSLIDGRQGEKKVVERLLPAPETPVAGKPEETGTWMSEEVKNKLEEKEAGGTPEKQPDIAPAAPKAVDVKAGKEDEDTPEDKPAAPVKVVAADEKPEEKKGEQFNPGKLRETAKAEEKTEAKPEPKAEPAEEKPMTVLEKMASLSEEKPAAQAEPLKEEPKPEPAPVAAPAEEAKPAPKEPEEAPKPAARVEAPKKAEEPKKVEEPKKAEEKASSTPPSGTRAQLGAYKSQAEAESQWKKISKNFAGEVKGKNHYVVRADLGSKGVYYRLQVAPFGSSQQVEQFCLSLVSEGQSCIVARGK